jgi:hypothetical protein
MLSTWCCSFVFCLVYVSGSSTRSGPWFVIVALVVCQFWFMFEGLALGQTLGLHLVLELCFTFGSYLRVQQ